MASDPIRPDVATSGYVPQRLDSFRCIYAKGEVILAPSFVMEGECILPERG